MSGRRLRSNIGAKIAGGIVVILFAARAFVPLLRTVGSTGRLLLVGAAGAVAAGAGGVALWRKRRDERFIAQVRERRARRLAGSGAEDDHT